ncbi:MAG: PD40 domain-containing protein [Leptospiraceae bacterium]|nr:PD40 domain-containing protein [Leptospiraceae bacterium]
MTEYIEESPPRAFISYTWDSEEHKEKIRNFSDLLREYGVDCNIDQYEISPPEGWTHWAINQVEESDYVLIVYTENYKNLANKKISSIANRDFVWQADLVTNILYQLGNRNEGGKFIPVVFQEKDKEHIPIQLRQYTSYNLNETENPKGFEYLYKHILRESNKPQIKLKTKKAYTKICPYRGLAPFREEDAQYFFGRENFTEKLLKEVHDKSLVAVIGPSGSGKSSVIYAGLIPYFKEKENSIVIKMRPGLNPISSMAYSIVDGISNTENNKLSNEDRDEKASEVIGNLLSKKETLDSFTRQIRNQTQKSVLIFVDQFEEILTLSHEEDKTKLFLNNILELAKSLQKTKSSKTKASSHICKIVLTMRIDFLGKALGNPDTALIFTDNAATETYIKKLIIGPMSSEELTASIERPALETGLNLENGLSELIIQSLGKEPGNLPLLEFCLLELWKKQEQVSRGIMTIQDYEEIGGVKGALVKHADEVFEGLSESDKEKVRRIFVQLVQPGSGTGDTRKIATLNEIGEGNFKLVKKLADERLIITNRSTTGIITAEVVHEALIREWGLLQAWMNTDRTFRIWQESLNTVLTIWKEEQLDGNLLKGNKLLEAEEWLTKKSEDISSEQQNFIQRSVANREREIQEKERLAKEKEAEQKRKRNLLKLIAVGSIVSAIIGLTLSWFSWTKMKEAKMNKMESDALFLESSYKEKKNYLKSYFEILKAGFEAVELSDKYLHVKLTILSTLSSFVYNPQEPDVYENPNEHPYAFARESFQLTGHSDSVLSVALSPNGSILATASGDKSAKLWDIKTGKEMQTLSAHGEQVNSVSFIPDGNILATASNDKTIKLWDVRTGKEIRTLEGHSHFVRSASFSPDGKMIVTGSEDATIRLWDVKTGKEIRTLEGHDAPVISVSFSPDGNMVVSGSLDTTIRLWDVKTGEKIQTFTGHKEGVFSVSFSSDGKTIASGSADTTIKLWDVQSGNEIMTLNGHNEGIFSVSFSSDGNTIASGFYDLYNIDTKFAQGEIEKQSIIQDFKQRILSTGEKGALVLIFNDNWIVCGYDNKGEFRELPLEPEDEIIQLLNAATIDAKIIEILRFRLNQTHVSKASIKLWDTHSGKEIRTITSHSHYATCLSFSPDGKAIATGSNDKTIKLWDVRTGLEIRTLFGHSNSITSVAFSPDGKLIATGSLDKTAKLWNINSGKDIYTILGHSEAISSIAFSPDGKTITTTSEDTTIKLWDVSSGEKIRTFFGNKQPIKSVSFSPDGQILATGSDDATVKLWDVNSGKTIQTFFGHGLGVKSVSFSPDGKTLATGSYDATIKLWNVKIEALLPLACEDLATHLNHLMSNKKIPYSREEIVYVYKNCEKVIQNKPIVSEAQEYTYLMEARKKTCKNPIANYKKALEINPDFLPAKEELARIYFYQGKEQEAFTLVNQKEYLYLDRARKNRFESISKGLGGNRREKAYADYKEALRINSSLQPAQVELANMYFEDKKYKESFDLVNNNYIYYHQAARNLSRGSKEELDLALEYAKKSYDLQPEYWENLETITRIYILMGERANAIKYNSELKNLVKNEEKANEKKVANDQYVDQDSQKRVAKYLQTTEKRDAWLSSHIEPEKNPAKGTYAFWYAIAYDAFYNKDSLPGDLDLAMIACKKGLQTSSDNPYLLNLLSEIYLRTGDLEKAKATNEEAAKHAKATGDRELIRRIEERKF